MSKGCSIAIIAESSSFYLTEVGYNAFLSLVSQPYPPFTNTNIPEQNVNDRKQGNLLISAQTNYKL